MALYIVTGYTSASGLTTLGINTFYCPNVPDNWSSEESSCSVFNSLLVLQISWALNFSSDISSPYHVHRCCLRTFAYMYLFSLLTTIPPTPRPRTQTPPTQRPNPHLRPRHPHHYCQRNALHPHPNRHRLGPNLHLVHGGNVHSHHGRLHACAEVPSQILEVLVERALQVFSEQLL